MKKRILTLIITLALLAALAPPMAVFAAGTTSDVTGGVVTGYTFSAPSAISLGDMTPGTPATGNSTDGNLTGNNAAGYTVTGTDANTGAGTGCMISGANTLHNKLLIGPAASPTDTADTVVSFLSTSGITDEAISLYVSQLATFDDVVATGYSITITFTVTAN